MKKIRFAIVGLIFVSNFSNAEIIGREAREIAMADAAVFWAVASAASKSGRAACSNSPLACSDDRGELGLALLGEKNSSNSNQAFIGLLKYRLDASLSENYTCYALKKGRRLMHQLTSAEPAKLYSDCSAIVKNLSTTNREILGSTSRDSICSNESNIANTLKNLKTIISKKQKVSTPRLLRPTADSYLLPMVGFDPKRPFVKGRSRPEPGIARRLRT